jgi:hypothetical protein
LKTEVFKTSNLKQSFQTQALHPVVLDWQLVHREIQGDEKLDIKTRCPNQ